MSNSSQPNQHVNGYDTDHKDSEYSSLGLLSQISKYTPDDQLPSQRALSQDNDSREFMHHAQLPSPTHVLHESNSNHVDFKQGDSKTISQMSQFDGDHSRDNEFESLHAKSLRETKQNDDKIDIWKAFGSFLNSECQDSAVSPTQQMSPSLSPVARTEIISPSGSSVAPTVIMTPSASPVARTQIISPSGSSVSPTKIMTPSSQSIPQIQEISDTVEEHEFKVEMRYTYWDKAKDLRDYLMNPDWLDWEGKRAESKAEFKQLKIKKDIILSPCSYPPGRYLDGEESGKDELRRSRAMLHIANELTLPDDEQHNKNQNDNKCSQTITIGNIDVDEDDDNDNDIDGIDELAAFRDSQGILSPGQFCRIHKSSYGDSQNKDQNSDVNQAKPEKMGAELEDKYITESDNESICF